MCFAAPLNGFVSGKLVLQNFLKVTQQAVLEQQSSDCIKIDAEEL